MNRQHQCYAIAVLAAATLPAQAARPIPIGESDTTLSYMTESGLRTLTGSADYHGAVPSDAVPLGGDPNIGHFNSANSFGRRILVDGALRDDESLLTNAFFKPPGHTTDFFADIVPGGSVTIEAQNIQFAEPVWIQQDTIMMHKLWDADQVDVLPNFYINLHNHETATEPIRDFDDFFPMLFTDFPMPNYIQGTLGGSSGIEIFGNGTSTLGYRLTVPYENFRNLEDVDQQVPAGLPAPFGFLEPFHFHVEFAVSNVPEPASILMLLVGIPLAMRRR